MLLTIFVLFLASAFQVTSVFRSDNFEHFSPVCPINLDFHENSSIISKCSCMYNAIICEGLDGIPEFSRSNFLWDGIFLRNQNISEIEKIAFINIQTRRIDLSNNPIGASVHRHSLAGKMLSVTRSLFVVSMQCIVCVQDAKMTWKC